MRYGDRRRVGLPKRKLDRLAAAGRFTGPIRAATLAIVLVQPPDGYEFDMGRAAQNMMLAAHSLGLGSCIVGFGAQVTHDAEIVEALELKENEKIYGPIVVGYPEIVPEPPPKKPPVVKWI